MTSRAATLLLLCAGAVPLRAQAPAQQQAAGVAAYRELSYDSAALLLRRSLEGRGSAALPGGMRSETWMYLGAAEYYRGRRDAARLAFREALRADVRVRADTLTFSPDVTSLFEGVRRSTAFVATVSAADTAIIAGRESWSVRLYASGAPSVRTTITSDEGGRVVRLLYEGVVADSLDLGWDGLDSAGVPCDGAFALTVSARAQSGDARTIRLPLAVRRTGRQGPLAQAGTEPLPELKRRSALGALLTGLAAGVFVAALPAVASGSSGGMSERFVIAGSLGLAGVAGFMATRGTAGAREPTTIRIHAGPPAAGEAASP